MMKIFPKALFAGHVEPTSVLFLLLVAAWSVFTRPAAAVELTGTLSAQVKLFQNAPLYEGQNGHSTSLAIEPEYYLPLDNGSNVTFTPFVRYDSADSERTHLDVRELNYYAVFDRFELRAGVGKVFWGATEFVHLVDIINQTDLVEDIDGEDKLGQPLLQLIFPVNRSALELYVLPFFRERTFPGQGGRLRGSIPIDGDNALFEHSDGAHHLDLAFRLSGTTSFLDYGLVWFRGTGREPDILTFSSPGPTKLIPYYPQIDQAGLDLQAVFGTWLIKFEGFRRRGQGETFFAHSGGVEYTFSGFWGSAIDLGAIAEYAVDSRGADSTSAFQEEVMMGLRLGLNDLPGTELLVGYSLDTDLGSRILRVEGSRRAGPDARITVEAGAFIDIDPTDVLYGLRDDDYLSVSYSYFY